MLTVSDNHIVLGSGGGGGGGDVVGAASSTDNAIARFDGGRAINNQQLRHAAKQLCAGYGARDNC